MVMGPEERSSKQQIRIVKTLDDNGVNWPLWHSEMCFIFESKGLLTHIEGTMIKPIINPNLVTLTQPLDEQITVRRLKIIKRSLSIFTLKRAKPRLKSLSQSQNLWH
jgi:hypothetical protein